MDENDFSKFGQSICDTVTDAVNSAMESMDFSGLSEKISSTADHIMQETVGAFTGKNGQENKKGNVYEKTDKEKLPWKDSALSVSPARIFNFFLTKIETTSPLSMSM